MEWLSRNSMNSAWDFTPVQNSDAADISKFFSFDDLDQFQDISEDLDRLFAEPGDAIESEIITPTGPQHLNHSAPITNASCSLASKLSSQQNRDCSLQCAAEQLELSPLLAQVNGPNPPPTDLHIEACMRSSILKPAVTPIRQSELDMNDPIVLDFYRQLVIFQDNLATPDIIFRAVDHLKQDTLYALARRLGLEYEYSLHQRQVRISRTTSDAQAGSLEFPGLQYAPIPSNFPKLPGTPPIKTSLSTSETHCGLMGFSGSGSNTDWNMLLENDIVIGEDQNQEPPDINLESHPRVVITDDEDFNLQCPGWELNVMEQNLSGPSMAAQGTLFPDVSPEFGAEASLEKYYPGREHIERTISEASRQKSTSSINFNDVVSAPHTAGQPIPTSQKSIQGTNFDASSNKYHSRRCNSTKSHLVDSKDGESPLDILDHGFTFIVDPSATFQRTSALAGNRQRNAISKSPSPIKFQACWKCKSTRKRCDAQNPCTCCRKGNLDSIWKAIGCRRGALEAHMPRSVLCLLRPTLGDQNLLLSTTMKLSAQRNRVDFEDLILPEGIGSDRRYDLFSNQISDTNHAESRSSLQELRKEIQELIWTLLQKSNKQCFQLLDEGGLYGSQFSTLMESSVQCFANSPDYTVIAQSLECLRSTLYFLTTVAYALEVPSHNECTSNLCFVHPSRDLENHLKQYVNELSREIFGKKNLRGDRAWWLPTFYSLCIQSYVRRILDSLQIPSTDQKITPENTYLHLAVSLFEAVSSGFDPIMGNQEPTNTKCSMIEPSFLEMMYRNEHSKTSYGFLSRDQYAKNSYGYLKYIFRVCDGMELCPASAERENRLNPSMGVKLTLESMPRSPLNTAVYDSHESDKEISNTIVSDQHVLEDLSFTNGLQQDYIRSVDHSSRALSPSVNRHTESWILESEAAWKLIERLQSKSMQRNTFIPNDIMFRVVDAPGFVNDLEDLETIVDSFLSFATSQIFPHGLRDYVRYNFVRKSPSKSNPKDVGLLWVFQSRNPRPFESSYELVIDLPVPAFPLKNSDLGPLYGIFLHHVIHGFFYTLPKHSKGTHGKTFLAIVHNINAWILGLGFTGIEVPRTCNFKVVYAKIDTMRRSMLRGLLLSGSKRNVSRT